MGGEIGVFIKNLRKEKPKEKWDFRIDRESPVGNPFVLCQEPQRDVVCDKYDVWFNKGSYVGDKYFEAYLKRLVWTYKEYGVVNLFCWCYPKRCHGETIANYILQSVGNEFIFDPLRKGE